MSVSGDLIRECADNGYVVARSERLADLIERAEGYSSVDLESEVRFFLGLTDESANTMRTTA